MTTGEMPAAAAAMLPPSRSAKIREHKAKRMDEVFKGRVFDIVREVHLPEGEVFVTVFGQKARHGFVIKDRVNGEQFVVGWDVLKQIHDRYLGVTLPTNPKYKIRKMRERGEI